MNNNGKLTILDRIKKEINPPPPPKKKKNKSMMNSRAKQNAPFIHHWNGGGWGVGVVLIFHLICPTVGCLACKPFSVVLCVFYCSNARKLEGDRKNVFPLSSQFPHGQKAKRHKLAPLKSLLRRLLKRERNKPASLPLLNYYLIFKTSLFAFKEIRLIKNE